MKAVILAAGASLRLRPLTDGSPKCLLDVNGFCMLGRMLECLQRNAVEKIIIVTGYLPRKIENFISKRFPDMNITYIHNEVYDSTNNSYSLWLAKDSIDGAFIQLDSDVLFEEGILTCLISSKHDDCLVVDMVSPLTEEAMKVVVSEERKIITLSKDIDVQQSHGEFIGVARFSDTTAGILFEYLDRLVQQGRTDVYYETGYQELINTNIPLYAVDTGDHAWIEVDTVDDLNAARRMFSG